MSSQRILGYDVARALAVFGMVVVNFKIATGADKAGPHWLLDLAGLLEGRAAATFVVLAGVGLSLMSQRARVAGDAALLARNRRDLLKRALFLFAVGLLYTPLWTADILHFYGVYITVGALLLAASNRRLLWLAGGFSGTFVALLLMLDYEQGWNWETLEYSGLWTPQGMVRHLFFNGFHPVFPWTAFLLIGMVIGRLDLRDAKARRHLLIIGLAVALISEAASRLLIRVFSRGADPAEREIVHAVFGTAPMPPMPLYVLAGAGTAAAVIAICVTITERARGNVAPEARSNDGAPEAHSRNTVWLRPLVATGQLALTLYVAHVIVGMGTLEALGRLGNQSPTFAIGSAAVFCVAAVAFADLWRRHFRRGPVEWLMRRVTSW